MLLKPGCGNTGNDTTMSHLLIQMANGKSGGRLFLAEVAAIAVGLSAEIGQRLA
jgi:hypothetical protein